jgi:DNA repair exonuclease SbcCD ATPase subunit
MEMKIPNARKYIIVWLGLMLFSVPVLVLALQEENGEVSQILQDARDKAAVLSRDADEMETLTRSDVSWQSHASMLETMKDDVNDLAQDVQKLTAERDKASPWQRQAIDRMLPMMKELAANTTAALNHLKDLQRRPVSPEYANYLRQNSETSKQLSDLISSVVQYDQTRAKLEKLELKLEPNTRASR